MKTILLKFRLYLSTAYLLFLIWGAIRIVDKFAHPNSDLLGPLWLAIIAITPAVYFFTLMVFSLMSDKSDQRIMPISKAMKEAAQFSFKACYSLKEINSCMARLNRFFMRLRDGELCAKGFLPKSKTQEVVTSDLWDRLLMSPKWYQFFYMIWSGNSVYGADESIEYHGVRIYPSAPTSRQCWPAPTNQMSDAGLGNNIISRENKRKSVGRGAFKSWFLVAALLTHHKITTQKSDKSHVSPQEFYSIAKREFSLRDIDFLDGDSSIKKISSIFNNPDNFYEPEPINRWGIIAYIGYREFNSDGRIYNLGPDDFVSIVCVQLENRKLGEVNPTELNEYFKTLIELLDTDSQRALFAAPH